MTYKRFKSSTQPLSFESQNQHISIGKATYIDPPQTSYWIEPCVPSTFFKKITYEVSTIFSILAF